MQILIFFTFACLFLNAYGRYVSVQEFTLYGYHEKIGIPKAYAIRAKELLRIVGGSTSNIAQHPHQAGIVTRLTSGAQSICGGSLIARNRVLTAAHCWWDGQNRASQFTVVLGSNTIFSGGTRVVTRDVVVHASWNPQRITHDIAIARISMITLTNNIQVIGLPTTADEKLDFSGLSGTISGWGKTTDAQAGFPPSTALHQSTVSVISNQVCQRSFQDPLQPSHLCTSGAGGRGTCDGDSGGPLTVLHKSKRIQIGIVSFGLADRCQSGFPSVYTRVTSFLSWINANMK